MYRCEVCNTIVQKRNKTKHNQTKNHKYYSNLILCRYVIKSVEVSKFKDVFNPYFTAHRRKFNFFTAQITLRPFEGEDILYYKIKVSNYVTYNIQSEHYTTHTTESANDFLHRDISFFSHDCSPKIIPEIEIVFISDPKDFTRQHYLEQPKSMLRGKFIGRFHESTPLVFEYSWLTDSFKEF